MIDAGADFIVRTGWNSLRLLQVDGTPFDLFATLAVQTEQEGEVQVRVHEGTSGSSSSQPLVLRLVIRRKDQEHVEAEQKRLRQNASKHGKKIDPRTLEAAKYIMLLTSLPVETFPTADILALYRFRWQIELAFKKFKSLAGLDQLPAKEPRLARAWIYARLIVAIIAERIAGQVPDAPLESTKPRASPSRWRLMKMALANIAAAIRGPIRWLANHGPSIRHIYEPPRKRTNQCNN